MHPKLNRFLHRIGALPPDPPLIVERLIVKREPINTQADGTVHELVTLSCGHQIDLWHVQCKMCKSEEVIATDSGYCNCGNGNNEN